MRYNIICITIPQTREEHSDLRVMNAEDPRDAQQIYDTNRSQGIRVQVHNNYLNMDETFLFERGVWRTCS